MARPTKLNRARHDEIVEYVRSGNYLETAAAAAGLNVSTVRRWMKRGARERQGPYAAFCTAVKEAEALAEAKCLTRIRMAGSNGVWQADAWYLERKHPAKWGRWDRKPDKPAEEVGKARDFIRRKDVRDLLDQVACRIGMAGDAGSAGDEA